MKEMQKIFYALVVESLMYTQVFTRPNIVFIVSFWKIFE